MTSDINILNDVSTLTNVPAKALNELVRYENLCIGNAIFEAKSQDKQCIVLNIGLGNLSINIANMDCKFTPGSELKNTLKACLAGKGDQLALKLEQAVVEKLLKIYDGVLT